MTLGVARQIRVRVPGTWTTMNTVTLTPTQARRLAVTKQRLAGPRPDLTADGIVDLIRDLGYIQIDPIRAVERTQYLVLWSRLGQYDPEHLHTALWKDKRLFEYWAHAASIVLTENFQIHRSQMSVAHAGSSKWEEQIRSWLEDNAGLRQRVVKELLGNRPMASDELEASASAPKRRGNAGGWGTGTDVSWMLSRLWSLGDVMVAGRYGLRRFWTLTDQWMPGWTPREQVSEREVVRRAAEISLKALGIGTQTHIRNHFVRGHYDGLDDVLAELVAEGSMVPARIEDSTGGQWSGDWYVHTEDLALLERIDEAWRPRTVLLSPFDNLICDRTRTLTVWDFDFTMEIYVPKKQRKYGYYVMPILHGDRLVGRIDPKMDRASGTLIVNAVYTEEQAKDGTDVADEVARTVEDLARFLGAGRVKYGRRKPAAWRPYLRSHRVRPR